MKIIGMLHCRNEEDIIGEVLENLISQGINLVVLDNGSTDNTNEICQGFIGKGILKLINFDTATFSSKLDLILRALYDVALTESPDWVLRCDSDEFLESGVKNQTLKEAITQADAKGDNLIQFDRFDFFMTDDDNESAKSIKEKLRYYSYQWDFIYRAWKFYPGIDVGNSGGHYPIFPENIRYKIYPNKFTLRHYTFRNEDQAKRKMEDRTRGTEFLKTGMGVDLHVSKVMNQDFSKRIDHKKLSKYNEDENWDFSIKHFPFASGIPKKKEDLFSENGTLKIRPKSLYELNLELQETRKKLLELRNVSGFAKMSKRAVKNRFDKIFDKKDSKEK